MKTQVHFLPYTEEEQGVFSYTLLMDGEVHDLLKGKVNDHEVVLFNNQNILDNSQYDQEEIIYFFKKSVDYLIYKILKAKQSKSKDVILVIIPALLFKHGLKLYEYINGRIRDENIHECSMHFPSNILSYYKKYGMKIIDEMTCRISEGQTEIDFGAN